MAPSRKKIKLDDKSQTASNKKANNNESFVQKSSTTTRKEQEEDENSFTSSKNAKVKCEDNNCTPIFLRNTRQGKKQESLSTSSKNTVQEMKDKKSLSVCFKNLKQENKENKCQTTLSKNTNQVDKCKPSSSGTTKQGNKKDEFPPKVSKNAKGQKKEKCLSSSSKSLIPDSEKCQTTLVKNTNQVDKCQPSSSRTTKQGNKKDECLPKVSKNAKGQKKEKCLSSSSKSLIPDSEECNRVSSSGIDLQKKKNTKQPSTKPSTSSKDLKDVTCGLKKQAATSSKVSKKKKYPPMVPEYPRGIYCPLLRNEDSGDDDEEWTPHKKNTYVPPPKEVKFCYNGIITKLSHENFVKSYCRFQQNGLWKPGSGSVLRDILMREVATLQPFMIGINFQRRCTALAWHPSDSHLLAVASKGGEIFMCHTARKGNYSKIDGVGPGGSIQALQISSINPGLLYTASMEGFINTVDYEKKAFTPLLKMANFDYSNWYTGLTVDEKKNIAVIGDTYGKITLLDLKSNSELFNGKLHKGKVSHVELSNRDSNILVTSSVDHVVKVWDLRKLKDKNDVLVSLQHEKAVTCSYFSLKNGGRLLTTDQNHELRVYSTPLFNLERSIIHPHRHFQHMTSIKAHWHPFEDIIVVGRYPDPKVPTYDERFRCIDFIDASSGKLLYELASQCVPGITSLSQFNHTGDSLATTTGAKLIMWSKL